MPKPGYLDFEIAAYAWKPEVDYREHPELYQVGKGEQGVLICEPYKNEIGPHWRFKTEAIAKESSTAIYGMFSAYLKEGEFVGADMSRKYLQMGFTRARRYANYKGGKKYNADEDYAKLERGTGDPEKAKAASVFYKMWQLAEKDPVYSELKLNWKKRYG